jgi:hypothetical protein
LPGVSDIAGDGKPDTSEHPVVGLHLAEDGMDLGQEEFFTPVCPEGDDARYNAG